MPSPVQSSPVNCRRRRRRLFNDSIRFRQMKQNKAIIPSDSLNKKKRKC